MFKYFLIYIAIGIILNLATTILVYGSLAKKCSGHPGVYQKLFSKYSEKTIKLPVIFVPNDKLCLIINFTITQLLWPLNVARLLYCGYFASREAEEMFRA